MDKLNKKTISKQMVAKQFMLMGENNKPAKVEELYLVESGTTMSHSTVNRLLTEQLWEIEANFYQNKSLLIKRIKEGEPQEYLDYWLKAAFDDIESKLIELKYFKE